jgi:hypothetical protein
MAWRFDQARFDARCAAVRAEEERRAYEEWLTTPVECGICYFFGCREGLVKIGFTQSLNQRFNKLKGNFGIYKLEKLATARGGRSREGYYHRMFAAHHVGGEWFNACPEIEAEIIRLRERDECGHGIVDPFAPTPLTPGAAA